MNTKLRLRRVSGAALVAALLVALGGCSVGPADSSSDAAPTGAAASTHQVSSTPPGFVRIVLRVGDEAATAVLADTSAAREFAAMLPSELTLSDPMGQAKSGELPSPLDITGAEPVFDPAVGELYYWAPSNTVAIFYADFGHSVPPPGLVRLGVIDKSLASISTAGNRFPVSIDLADRAVALIGP